MENSARSKRTREAAVEAALRIIARDGVSRLTLDAIARETGVSKGAITHQFKSKHEVLKALLDHERAYYDSLRERYRAEAGESPAPALAGEIAISRNLLTNPNSAAFAVMGALAEEPELMVPVRANSAAILEQLRSEARDPDLAVLRWAAANGIALMALFGFSPLTEADHERLFARLTDEAAWAGLPSSQGKSDSD